MLSTDLGDSYVLAASRSESGSIVAYTTAFFFFFFSFFLLEITILFTLTAFN